MFLRISIIFAHLFCFVLSLNFSFFTRMPLEHLCRWFSDRFWHCFLSPSSFCAVSFWSTADKEVAGTQAYWHPADQRSPTPEKQRDQNVPNRHIIHLVWLKVSYTVYSACVITQSGSPFNGPIMAMNKGCCNRANRALTRDCIPVRLPNWDDGYLQTHKDTFTCYQETILTLFWCSQRLLKWFCIFNFLCTVNVL